MTSRWSLLLETLISNSIFGENLAHGASKSSCCVIRMEEYSLWKFIRAKRRTWLKSTKALASEAGMVLNLAGRLQLVEFTKLYFDNFFTSLALLERLSEMGLYGTGTIRSNRLQGTRLETDSDMKKR